MGNSKGIKFIHPPIHADEWMCKTKMVFFFIWVQLGAREYRGGRRLEPGFYEFDEVWQIGRAIVELRADLSPASRGQSGPQCPRERVCALGLAARYIKTGASVTKSALWKLRGLADGHFWRCRSIIKMKSSDWAGLACSVAQKSSSLSLLLISNPLLSCCLSQVTEVQRGLGGKK